MYNIQLKLFLKGLSEIHLPACSSSFVVKSGKRRNLQAYWFPEFLSITLLTTPHDPLQNKERKNKDTTSFFRKMEKIRNVEIVIVLTTTSSCGYTLQLQLLIESAFFKNHVHFLTFLVRLSRGSIPQSVPG